METLIRWDGAADTERRRGTTRRKPVAKDPAITQALVVYAAASLAASAAVLALGILRASCRTNALVLAPRPPTPAPQPHQMAA